MPWPQGDKVFYDEFIFVIASAVWGNIFFAFYAVEYMFNLDQL